MVCPSRTDGETGGQGPGPWQSTGPGMEAYPGIRGCPHSWGKASSCCPLQPAQTLQVPRSNSNDGKRQGKRVLATLVSHWWQTEWDLQSHIWLKQTKQKNNQLFKTLSSANSGANLLPLCPVQLPCIPVRITDPPSSMWHGCWCTRTPLLMTSAPPPPPPPCWTTQ